MSEKQIPNLTEAIGVAMTLDRAAAILESYTADDISTHPRELVIRGRISVKALQRIQMLGFEVLLAGERGNYVLSTGNEKEASTPLPVPSFPKRSVMPGHSWTRIIRVYCLFERP